MIYFTSDQHFFHENIIKYCARPFKNAAEMNQTIIDNYCDVVTEKDEVYFLGDLTMCGPAQRDKVAKVMEKLPGIKHLILGNHDSFKPFIYHKIGFSSVHTALKTTFNHDNMAFWSTEFYMAHDPAWAQIPETFWVCGHIHNNWKSQKTLKGTIIVNVGVDVWDFKPVSYDEMLKELRSHIGLSDKI